MNASSMKFWHYLILAAVALLLAGSFFLPNAVAGFTDSRRLDNLVMIDSVSISFDSTPELTLHERIALVASRNTEMLPLKTGNAMDFDAAKEATVSELTRFFRGSPFRFDTRGHVVEDGAAALVIDAAVPEFNLRIWEFILVDRAGNKVTVTIDDETGLILRMIYKLSDSGGSLTGDEPSGSSNSVFHDSALKLTEMMKEYYGHNLTLADYHYSGNIAYYRADLFGGSRVIPMYGAVRAASFTIHERVATPRR